MSGEAYNQAIANVAYELNRMTEEVEQSEGDPFAAAVVFMSGANPEIAERAKKIDYIITVIADTYHRTEEQIDRDIQAAIQQRVQ